MDSPRKLFLSIGCYKMVNKIFMSIGRAFTLISKTIYYYLMAFILLYFAYLDRDHFENNSKLQDKNV